VFDSVDGVAAAAVVRETLYTDHHLSAPHTRIRGNSAASSFKVFTSWDTWSGSYTASVSQNVSRRGGGVEFSVGRRWTKGDDDRETAVRGTRGGGGGAAGGGGGSGPGGCYG